MLSNLVDENTWVISDTHFGHDNVLAFEPCRVEAMHEQGFDDQNEWLIHNWNANVGENDLVLHLGDLLFKSKSTEVLYKLNGRILMILGNHDFHQLNFYRKYAKRYPDKFMLIESINGLDASALIKEIKGKKVMFSHYPLISVDPYTRDKSKETRDLLAQVFDKEKCDLNIHGHLHSNDKFTDKEKEFNVSIERIGFKPIRLGDLIK